MMHRRMMTFAAAGMLVLASCQENPSEVDAIAPRYDQSAQTAAGEISAMMDVVNGALAAEGAEYRVLMAEYMTTDGAEAVGATILQKNVGNKRLGADFVPNDPRRAGWSGAVGGANDDITYAIDGTGDAVPVFGGLTAAETDAVIVRSTNVWGAVACSDLEQTRRPSGSTDIGFIAALNGLGGSFAVVGDVQHAGFRDINFQQGVLGVTFTLIWTVGGVPTDIDNNGLADVAFREIYYDPSYAWRDNGVNNVDLESVATHEIGHGLSQGHFGVIFDKNGVFTANPRAVMNAFYQAPYRILQGTDNGGHCTIWGNWPVG